MNAYAPARPNLVATLFDTLTETLLPLLQADNPPALSDPGIEDLAAQLSAALTAALRATRTTTPSVPAPGAVRPGIPPRPATARVASAQVGPAAGAVKPGSLRARLIDHLAAHPGQAFTVTELTRATQANSGGAVGAALGTMTAHGEAIQTTDSPRRYTAPTGPALHAPAVPDDQDHPGEQPESTPPTRAAETNATTPNDTAPTPQPAADTATADPADAEHHTTPGIGTRTDTIAQEQTEPPAPTTPTESATRARTKRR